MLWREMATLQEILIAVNKDVCQREKERKQAGCQKWLLRSNQLFFPTILPRSHPNTHTNTTSPSYRHPTASYRQIIHPVAFPPVLLRDFPHTFHGWPAANVQRKAHEIIKHTIRLVHKGGRVTRIYNLFQGKPSIQVEAITQHLPVIRVFDPFQPIPVLC